jgi:small subunit ribosomal protein S20
VASQARPFWRRSEATRVPVYRQQIAGKAAVSDCGLRRLRTETGVIDAIDPNLKDYSMANTSSAKKAARQMVRRTEINKARRSRLKSTVRKVEEAIASGKKSDAQAALKAAEPMLVQTAQKGVLHKKTASRKVSRLTARVNALQG